MNGPEDFDKGPDFQYARSVLNECRARWAESGEHDARRFLEGIYPAQRSDLALAMQTLLGVMAVSDVAELVVDVLAHIVAGNYIDALETADEIDGTSAGYPSTARLARCLAILSRAGDVDVSDAFFALAAADPANGFLATVAAKVALEAGDPDRAVFLARMTLDERVAEDENSEILLVEAQALLDQGCADEAFESLFQAAQIEAEATEYIFLSNKFVEAGDECAGLWYLIEGDGDAAFGTAQRVTQRRHLHELAGRIRPEYLEVARRLSTNRAVRRPSNN